MKKADFALIAILFVGIIGLFLYLNDFDKYVDYYVEVRYDGEVVDKYLLDDNLEFTKTYQYSGTNTVEISNGTVQIIDADCPDLDCLIAKITKNSINPVIICAPNRLVVKIIGGKVLVDGVV